jgi:hypothetical protein
MDLTGLGEDIDALRRVAEAGGARQPPRIELRAEAGSLVEDLGAVNAALELVERRINDEVEAIVRSLHRRVLHAALVTGSRADMGSAASRQGAAQAEPRRRRAKGEATSDPGSESALGHAAAVEMWGTLTEIAMGQSAGLGLPTPAHGAGVTAPFAELATCVPTGEADRRRRDVLGWP